MKRNTTKSTKQTKRYNPPKRSKKAPAPKAFSTEPTFKPELSYRELQQVCRKLREMGLTDTKLNVKADVLRKVLMDIAYNLYNKIEGEKAAKEMIDGIYVNNPDSPGYIHNPSSIG